MKRIIAVIIIVLLFGIVSSSCILLNNNNNFNGGDNARELLTTQNNDIDEAFVNYKTHDFEGVTLRCPENWVAAEEKKDGVYIVNFFESDDDVTAYRTTDGNLKYLMRYQVLISEAPIYSEMTPQEWTEIISSRMNPPTEITVTEINGRELGVITYQRPDSPLIKHTMMYMHYNGREYLIDSFYDITDDLLAEIINEMTHSMIFT